MSAPPKFVKQISNPLTYLSILSFPLKKIFKTVFDEDFISYEKDNLIVDFSPFSLNSDDNRADLPTDCSEECDFFSDKNEKSPLPLSLKKKLRFSASPQQKIDKLKVTISDETDQEEEDWEIDEILEQEYREANRIITNNAISQNQKRMHKHQINNFGRFFPIVNYFNPRFNEMNCVQDYETMWMNMNLLQAGFTPNVIIEPFPLSSDLNYQSRYPNINQQNQYDDNNHYAQDENQPYLDNSYVNPYSEYSNYGEMVYPHYFHQNNQQLQYSERETKKQQKSKVEICTKSKKE